MIKTETPTAIDLFCGCGGMSSGFLDAGIHVVAGIDFDKSSIETYRYNHEHRGGKGLVRDLSKMSGDDVLRDAGVERCDILLGGPPCQAFSIAGKRRGLSDARGHLIFDFVRLVAEVRPAAFVMENVPNLASIEDGRLFDEVLSGFLDAGYHVARETLVAADYGVSQMRKRIFVIGAQSKKIRPSPTPTHSASSSKSLFDDVRPYVNVEHAIGDLPDVLTERAKNIPNHEPTMHSEEMIRTFEELRPGTRDPKSFHDRLERTKVSYTLRAGSGNFSPLRPVHYEHNRVITVRESARIQSFSDSFIWPDWVPRVQQYRQVGNAVPPLLAKAVATLLADELEWELRPTAFAGDPNTREPHSRLTWDERQAARRQYIRGASLGGRLRRGATIDDA